MGSVCCVAARDKTLPNRTDTQSSRPHAYSHRNTRYSPSWSFQWDNRSRNRNSTDNSLEFLQDHSVSNSANMGSEIKGGFSTETPSDGGSPFQTFHTPVWPKSLIFPSSIENLAASASDLNSSLSKASSFSIEEKDFTKSSTVADASELKLSSPAASFSEIDASSSQSRSLSSDPKTKLSPGHQVSDSRIPAVKLVKDASVSDGRQSFMVTSCSNDFMLGSQGGSSDGWSMRAFSELVASSQRERSSFDSENLGSNHGKITRSNSQQLSSSLMDMQTCGICSKLLGEKPSWASQRIMTGNEISVVAVLVCGHVYHAECLESATPETNRYDPPCPLCSGGGKLAVKSTLGKASKAETDPRARNKISRIGVMDSDHDVYSDSGHRKSIGADGKGPTMARMSSFGRPFLKRHFSIGSKPARSVSENESTRKKGFWARYRKD